MSRLISDFANENVSRYKAEFDAMPPKAKETMNDVKNAVYLGFNTRPVFALMIMKGHRKSNFQLSAEINGMSLSEFAGLPYDNQVALISDNGRSANTQFHKRRVKFSSQFLDGHELNYYSLSMGTSTGNTHYGKCYVVLKPESVTKATALKYDSLKRYFTVNDDFLVDECIGDLLPYAHVECLIASKFNASGFAGNFKAIIKAIDTEVAANDMPLEVMTCEVVDASCISSIVMCSTAHEHFTGLNKREARGEVLSDSDINDLALYDDLSRTLRKYGIKLKVV